VSQGSTAQAAAPPGANSQAESAQQGSTAQAGIALRAVNLPAASATQGASASRIGSGMQGATASASQSASDVPHAKPVDLAARAAPASAPEPLLVASADEPGHPSGGVPTSASGGPTYDELVAVGRALSKKNKRLEASEAFRRALIQSPQGSAALSGLGYVYLNADEKQHAREYAERAVLADASNAEGWIVLGAALELLGDRAGARDAYKNCVERGQGPYLTECRRVSH
jgi:predicted Zn-dependent protease